MTLLFSYILALAAFLFKNKNLKILLIFYSIALTLSLYFFFPIGGDYISLQIRSDNLDFFQTNFFSQDIIFHSITILSRYTLIEVPILYFFFMVIIILFYENKNYRYLPIYFIFLYYFILTGFQRQGLACLIFLLGLKYHKLILQNFFLIFSLFAHQSIIIVLLIRYFYFFKKIRFHPIVISLIIFLVIKFSSIYLSEGIFSHYIRNYFLVDQLSRGVIFRFLSVGLCFLTLIYINKQDFIKDLNFNIFQVLFFLSGFLVLNNSTTAGDRLLYYAIVFFIASDTMKKLDHNKLILVCSPFILMNLSWVVLSDQSYHNW